MTHAMQFVGADLPEGREFPTKWRIEVRPPPPRERGSGLALTLPPRAQNSHGKELGDKGYALMTDEWFDEYMYGRPACERSERRG
jgi:aminopeptidase C